MSVVLDSFGAYSNLVGGSRYITASAWVAYDGSTTPPSIRNSFNISSVVRSSTGVFVITYTSSLPVSSPSVIGSSENVRALRLDATSNTSTTVVTISGGGSTNLVNGTEQSICVFS